MQTTEYAATSLHEDFDGELFVCHADANCPFIAEGTPVEGDPTLDRWTECDFCVRGTKHTPLAGLPARFYGTEEPEATRTHGEPGSGHRHAPAGPSITDKQLAFLSRLAGERGLSIDPTWATMSKRAASVKIDELMATPRPAADAKCTWTRHGDGWGVKVPGSETTGDTVTIHKADGSTVEAVLGALIASFREYNVFEASRKQTTQTGGGALPDVPAGHYAIASTGHNDLAFYRVDRPTKGQWAGRTYVKLIVGGHPEQNVRYAAIPGILARIIEAGVAESAALYGTELGRCCRCNRHLTDETSRSLGIGPECRSKM